MNCSGCSKEMRRLTLDGAIGKVLEVDLCVSCRAIWFEPYESLALTPASTLELFRIIAEAPEAQPWPKVLRCPTCAGPLRLAHDRQRDTRFRYLRCTNDHGRFISFEEFLKEKSFVQALSPQRLAELRKTLRAVNCSNCGGPVDLSKETACRHCGSPLMMLDREKMRDVAREYAAGRKPGYVPEPPPKIAFEGGGRDDVLKSDFAWLARWIADLLRL